jgi:hypothetical protein
MCEAVILTAPQSIIIHGWYNPKRMLSWKDFVENKISVKLCSTCGVDGSVLYAIQPSLKMWIETCDVSFKDVEYMTNWPLHPFNDLGGHIPDLIEHKYSAKLLRTLGINHSVLLGKKMTVEWMKMFNFSEREWALLSLDLSK